MGLRALLLLLLLALAGCATEPVSAEATPVLVLDLAAGTATTPDWTARAEDCSDEVYACVSIPGRMVIAFPKACRSIEGGQGPEAAFGRLSKVAPAPHLAPPAGSFVVTSFPRVLMFYYTPPIAPAGLQRVRLVRAAPGEPGFNPNDFSAEYVITVRGRPDFFVCS